MFSRRWAAAALSAGAAAVALATFLAGCGGGKVNTLLSTGVPTPTPTSTPNTSGFILRLLTVAGNQGVTAPTTLSTGAIPEACSGAAPTVSAATNPAQVVRGGSFTVSVVSPTQVDRLLVGARGYSANFSADLNAVGLGIASRATSACCSALAPKYPMRTVTKGQIISGRAAVANGFEYQAVLSIPSDLPASVTSFTLTLATVKNGVQSCLATLPVTIVAAGQSSSRLQVSLSWSAPVDLDLHVKTPAGREIYYGNQADGTGGTLDVDSNSSCSIDNIDQENVSWGNTAPPAGVYTISPQLYSNCDKAGPFPYVITVNNNGVQTVYQGTFTATGNADKSFTIQVGANM